MSTRFKGGCFSVSDASGPLISTADGGVLDFSNESLCKGEDMTPSFNGTNIVGSLLVTDEIDKAWHCHGMGFLFIFRKKKCY
jgi:hypothetical protein